MKKNSVDFLEPFFPPLHGNNDNENEISALEKNVPSPFINEPVPTLTNDLETNIQTFLRLFSDDDGFIIRRTSTRGAAPVKCAIFFIESMTSDANVSEDIIKSIVSCRFDIKSNGEHIINELAKSALFASDIKYETDMQKIVYALLVGNSVIIADGCSAALTADTKGYEKRSISEPANEKLLRGPHEGFSETISTNISLIRRRICTLDLKVKFFTFGNTTNTKVAIMYLDSLTDKKILNELYRRLSEIDLKGGFDTSFLEDKIKDTPSAPFNTVGSTERPDTAASKLLEGRIAIIMNGSPTVLTVPFLFADNFRSNEDLYLNYYFSNIGRILRIVSFFLSVSVPAVFIALLSFHKQMMPTELTLSILSARNGVPFPAIIECLAMLAVFQILRETAMRMPSAISQTLSIVGTLVIGDAAVTARFVSTPMLIIVAVTAMMGLMNPSLKSAQLTYRTALIFLSGLIGLYGCLIGMMFMAVQILSIRSFGVPYVTLFSDNTSAAFSDFIVKGPWRKRRDEQTVKIPEEQ